MCIKNVFRILMVLAIINQRPLEGHFYARDASLVINKGSSLY